MKVIVSAFSNLYTDQRIEKVCQTLYDNGYQIELIGNDWGGNGAMERPYPFSRIHIKSKNLRGAYLEFNKKLYTELLKKADKNTILHANDIDAILPNLWVSKKLGVPLIFDSHEIFTEMPAIKGRWTQKIWQMVERYSLPKIKYMMTESESYAQWFRERYPVSPVVVRNIPRKITTPITIPQNTPKVILYQGAINQSRGIDKAIQALIYIDNVIFKIAGDGPKRKEYEALVEKLNLNHKVSFLGKLHPTELRKLTQTADVGLSIEENGGVSYLYSLPNKVADYIQSRVPLVMINFPEMKRVYNDFKVGEIVDSHNPKALADAITRVLEKGRLHYQSELEKAAEALCWEKDEEKILSLYHQVIAESNII
ncbi:glycosyltransferase [Riemerella anatipestifer]|nr:glycosyltransferase [Riemerella anatipestifer]